MASEQDEFVAKNRDLWDKRVSGHLREGLYPSGSVEAGTYTVRYRIAAGLAGRAKAVLAGGGPVQGQLTASIAPEVTQPIAAIVTNAQAALHFLNRRPPDLDEVRQVLDCIVRDAYRASDVTYRIRGLFKEWVGLWKKAGGMKKVLKGM